MRQTSFHRAATFESIFGLGHFPSRPQSRALYVISKSLGKEYLYFILSLWCYIKQGKSLDLAEILILSSGCLSAC